MLTGVFRNCYGIKELNMGNGIDFSKSNKALIYAPNGVMKTSFAKVFEDLSKGVASKDRLLSNVTTSYSITYCNKKYEFSSSDQQKVSKCDDVYVINSFSDSFEFTKETVSTLLADEDTRNEYNMLMAKFSNKIKNLEAELSIKAGITKPKIKKTLIEDFELEETSDWPQIIDAVNRVIHEEPTIPYFDQIKLAVLFNEKAVKEYEKPDFRAHIQEYIERLGDLLQNSELLNDNFNDRNAEALTKAFTINDLFSVRHKVILRDGREIHSVEEWKNAVIGEVQRLYEDQSLKSVFEKLKKDLTANNDVEAARKIIIEHRSIIPHLFDIQNTKKRMWAAYCSQLEISFEEYYNEITKFTEQVRSLYARAAVESEQWNHVVTEFNRRFRVPFTVEINNKANYILKDEMPNLSFKYERGCGDDLEVADYLSKNDLFPSLSMGEKRAMYLLYVLFDLERIKTQAKINQKKLIIADDISDSFDYKNKYAIIEYLSDLSQNPGIDLLILTHNFDFYRTVQSRLNVNRNHCYITLKDNSGKITIQNFPYLKDFFNNVILKGIKSSNKTKRTKMLIASIPFYRNLAEYCGNDNDKLKLTCFLHNKSEPVLTSNATMMDLWSIIRCYITENEITFGAENYLSTIQAVAIEIMDDNDEISLENKLILSMASRLRAEQYLKQVIIANYGCCQDESKNQMRNWTNKAAPYLSEEEKRLMDDINLITPETIHLNSFMFEPLIDVSIWSLKDIFARTLKLSAFCAAERTLVRLPADTRRS